jgi:5'-methylthioadenosine phosphorylase
MEGVYVCTEGPRYESPAEVRMFRSLGCDVVGMTGLPEAVLSRELGLCYASICYITNMAAGLGPSISAEEISAESRQMEEKAMRIILNAVEAIPKKRNCQCYSSLEGARV